MSFVFEARLLPFDDISEAYAARIRPVTVLYALDRLSLWDRCMLTVVLPIVQQRHSAGAAVDVASPSPATIQTSSNGQKAVVWSESLGKPSLEDVTLALTIVHALDELEVVYDSCSSTCAELKRQRQRQRQSALGGTSVAEMQGHAASPPKKTSEDILMEQLLQERFSETNPYLPESSDDEGTNDDEADVDVAMCFNSKGESLGIGSARVFGGHGYQPPLTNIPPAIPSRGVEEKTSHCGGQREERRQ
ncbi:hypothetical protein JKF63_06831 [Porcisia hertigi]|uniref:Uncharacterized protein n=1 Tax=Porcisia hertigi TaxID=2761500 RepID=A0A836LJ67_9TRYP|nr:hypothetical protein JKF63_06831 [Porcisia hertigi]